MLSKLFALFFVCTAKKISTAEQGDWSIGQIIVYHMNDKC